MLGKTLGVPLFQEQAMQIAIVGAGFTPEEADRLRRAMATFKRNGDIHLFRDKFIAGMVANGYDARLRDALLQPDRGLRRPTAFPESHAASFALLVYVSAWIKCFYPEVFACALLNSQPMGFYAPAQIVRDAREHGVEVRPVDVNHSVWDCTLEPSVRHPRESGGPGADRFDGRLADAWIPAFAGMTIERHWALRLGLRQIKGFAEADAERLVAARGAGYRGSARAVAAQRPRPRRARAPRRSRRVPLARARPPPRVVGA